MFPSESVAGSTAIVAHRELTSLAQLLLADCCRRQNVQRDRLTIHADRGTSMMYRPAATQAVTHGISWPR
jgi:putative transposase